MGQGHEVHEGLAQLDSTSPGLAHEEAREGLRALSAPAAGVHVERCEPRDLEPRGVGEPARPIDQTWMLMWSGLMFLNVKHSMFLLVDVCE